MSDFETAQAARRRLIPQLRAFHGYVSSGITKTDGALVILVLGHFSAPDRRCIPATFEGFPVRVQYATPPVPLRHAVHSLAFQEGWLGRADINMITDAIRDGDQVLLVTTTSGRTPPGLPTSFGGYPVVVERGGQIVPQG